MIKTKDVYIRNVLVEKSPLRVQLNGEKNYHWYSESNSIFDISDEIPYEEYRDNSNLYVITTKGEFEGFLLMKTDYKILSGK